MNGVDDRVSKRIAEFLADLGAEGRAECLAQLMRANSEPYGPKWAEVELFGHRSVHGLVREVELFGVPFVRVDAVVGDADADRPLFFSPRAVWALAELTERDARAVTRDPEGGEDEEIPF